MRCIIYLVYISWKVTRHSSESLMQTMVLIWIQSRYRCFPDYLQIFMIGKGRVFRFPSLPERLHNPAKCIRDFPILPMIRERQRICPILGLAKELWKTKTPMVLTPLDNWELSEFRHCYYGYNPNKLCPGKAGKSMANFYMLPLVRISTWSRRSGSGGHVHVRLTGCAMLLNVDTTDIQRKKDKKRTYYCRCTRE